MSNNPSNKRMRYTLLVLSFFTCCLAGAQTFPVQITTQLNVPYSITLSDYASSNAERIVFSVFADVSRPALQVKFRLRIEGQNVVLQTRQDFNPPPVTIQGGIMERLTGFDLADYFDPANLTFQGITRQQFQKTGKLPEGLYRFQLEAFEYNRNIKISNTGTASGWLILNDPPIVNLPRQNEKLRAQDPQNLVIQWTPRHTGSPNAAFSTEYEVTLVEVWPSTRNPNDAILTSQPVFETTTSATTLIYGPAETPLEPGRRYALRIRAKAIAGVEEVNLFKNNGYSEVVTFVYGDACDLPTDISADVISSSRIGLQWQSLLNHTGYSIKYRVAGSSNWYESKVISTETELTSLKPATRYEYQVAAGCGPFNSTYSPIAVATTKDEPAIAYSCGLPVDPFNLDPAELAPSLKTGDIIDAGDFRVTLAKVEGSNGTFSGEGVIVVPYFNKAKVKTEFAGIKVNKDLRMVSGFMNVTGAGVDVIPQGLLDLMDDLEEGLDLLDSALNTMEANLPETFDPNSFVADTLINVSGGISSVYKDDDGTVVIVDKNGQETRLPAGTSAAVTDSSGNAYLVDSKGNVHKTDAATAKKAGNREYNLTMKFVAAESSKYGFDDLPAGEAGSKFAPLAEKYESINGKYNVAWKALSLGQSDGVVAKLESTGIDLSKIRYELGGQPITPLPNASTPGSHLLQLTGLNDGEEGLLALYSPADPSGKDQVLGKLNVVTYKEISKKLVVVPVNGNAYKGTDGSLSAALNKIYNQAVVQWSVSIADAIQVPGISPFDDGESGLLTNYTPDMKKVISAYKDRMSDDTYYIFLVSNPKNKPGLLGYMPRSKPVGFVFVNNHSTEEALVHTIAHELGHGAFNLQHTFNDDSKGGKYKIQEGTTDNLMDYTVSGTRLYKHQWDKIRYNDIVIGMLEEDEEAENRVNDGIDLVGNIIKKVNHTVPGAVLVGTISTDRPYLRTGYSEYTSDSSKTLLARYTAEIRGDVVVYVDASGKIMPYKVDVAKSGNATINVLNDDCTYSRAIVRGWQTPTDPSQVSGKITELLAQQRPQWETFSLFKEDPSCFIINSLSSLISNDKKTDVCNPVKIDADVRKLQNLFQKQSFTNEELAVLIVDEYVCLSALRKMSWTNLSNAIQQLGNTNEYVWERKEIAILRLMAAINSSNYKDFITLLENDNNKLLLNLVSKVHDKSIDPWDGNNFTSFIGGLCAIYNLKPEIWQARIKPFENKDLLGQVVSLAPFEFTPPSMGAIVDIIMPSLGQAKFEGKLNSDKNIEISRWVKYLVGSGGLNPRGSISIPMWTKDSDFELVKLNPLDPVIILTKNNLPLVETAINGLEPIGENLYVVPAIFLDYKSEKEFNDAVEKGAMIAFDVVTIATSGGAALATKIHWARRLWAITEVVAAGGNIAINTGVIDPNSNYGKAVNSFNIVMGAIGLKNAAKGLKNVAKNLPDQVKAAIQNRQNLRPFLTQQIQSFRQYLADLKKPGGGWDNLDDVRRQQLSQQEGLLDLLNDARVRVARTLDEIAPNGVIPPNSQTNNLFHQWFDNLTPEELDMVLNNPTLKESLEARIRYPGGLHEWCMVCEIRKFKDWEIRMSEIHRFRTRTQDLTGVNPITGETFRHGGPGSTVFHNELRTLIQSSNSLTDFNSGLVILINRWQIDPSLLPPLIQ